MPNMPISVRELAERMAWKRLNKSPASASDVFCDVFVGAYVEILRRGPNAAAMKNLRAVNDNLDRIDRGFARANDVDIDGLFARAEKIGRADELMAALLKGQVSNELREALKGPATNEQRTDDPTHNPA